MTYRVAINGFGRIGRDVVRAVVERDLFAHGIEIVAVNDLWPAASLVPLLRNDSTFGPLDADVGELFAKSAGTVGGR